MFQISVKYSSTILNAVDLDPVFDWIFYLDIVPIFAKSRRQEVFQFLTTAEPICYLSKPRPYSKNVLHVLLDIDEPLNSDHIERTMSS